MKKMINTENNQTLEQMDKVVELSMLFDFYGDLLKENQKTIFEDYVLNDLSLSEIADEWQISRQGVHDIIKRCTKQLKEYELKLRLIEKFNAAGEKVNEIKELAELMNVTGDLTSLNKIRFLADDILNML